MVSGSVELLRDLRADDEIDSNKHAVPLIAMKNGGFRAVHCDL